MLATSARTARDGGPRVDGQGAAGDVDGHHSDLAFEADVVRPAGFVPRAGFMTRVASVAERTLTALVGSLRSPKMRASTGQTSTQAGQQAAA